MKVCIALSIVVGLLSTSVFGQSSRGENSFYGGVKVGRATLDSGFFDDSTTFGIVLGYEFEDFAVEIERMDAEGDTNVPAFLSSISPDYDLTTTALYIAYRTPGDIYFKVRAGYLDEEISLDGSFFSVEEDDSGLSGGIAAGFDIENLLLEFEYTLVEEDINYFTVGLGYKF